jgi:hypothetical protein
LVRLFDNDNIAVPGYEVGNAGKAFVAGSVVYKYYLKVIVSHTLHKDTLHARSDVLFHLVDRNYNTQLQRVFSVHSTIAVKQTK